MTDPKTHVQDRIETMLDGEVGIDEEKRIRDHYESCTECRKALESSVAIRRLLDEYPPQVSSLSVWPAVSERLARERSALYRFAAAAVMTACAVGGVSLGLYLGSRHPSAPPPRGGALWSTIESTVAADSPGLHSLYLGETESEEASIR